METSPVYVGIDVAQEHVDGAVAPAGEEWRSSHDEEGIAQMLALFAERVRPPDAIGSHFGMTSFREHQEEAAARGIPVKLVRNFRIELDVDTPDDLGLFVAYENVPSLRPRQTSRAYAALERLGVAKRLAELSFSLRATDLAPGCENTRFNSTLVVRQAHHEPSPFDKLRASGNMVLFSLPSLQMY